MGNGGQARRRLKVYGGWVINGLNRQRNLLRLTPFFPSSFFFYTPLERTNLSDATHQTAPQHPRAHLLSNMAESINTLRYAGRAMNIKNTAVRNEGASGTPVSFAEVRSEKNRKQKNRDG